MSDPRGDATREALLRAGMDLFSRLGFHAASSRALAEAAGVNQALIGYHFGGKQGLYLAVFETIVDAFRQRIGPAMAEVEGRLGMLSAGPRDDAVRERALGVLCGLLDRFVDLFTSHETEAWAMLIVREQQAPTEAFERVYSGFMGRALGVFTRLVAAIRGEPADDPDVRLLAVTLIGQVLVFRVARTTALRQLDWREIGPEEAAVIKARLHRNTRALLLGA